MSGYSPYEQEYRPRFAAPSITWGVRLLLLVNVCVFGAQLIVHIPFGEHPAETPGGAPTWWFSFQPALFYLVWKPFTYQFLHGGFAHLFFNMLWLFFFGPEVERSLGSRGFIRFYVICGAVAVLATIPAWLTGARGGLVPVTGASGALMAVLIAFAMINPNREIYLFPLPFPVTARGIVVIVIVLNVVQSLGQSNVSVETHFGGMAAGFVYMKALPHVMARYRARLHAREEARKAKMDKVGEAVDNIFKFDNWKKK